MDEDDDAVSAIHLYQPATGEWVKVGDLPACCIHAGYRRKLVAAGDCLLSVRTVAT